MDYSQLTDAIQSYTENTFTATELATFVQQAEQRIYNSMQFPSQKSNATGSLTSGEKFLNAPSDFLAVYALAIIDGSTGAYTYLIDKDVNFIREAYPVPTVTGTPKYYAVYGPQAADAKELRFIVGPTPDATYATALEYFAYPESIVTATNTWLGDNFDSVLLYGSLVEAYTFMKGDADMMKMYDDKYKEALMLAKRLADGMLRQDAYRSGQVRVPVS